MKFYDRESEREALEKFPRVAVLGRRRVGKTRLVEEAFKDRCLTLFLAEKKESLVCRDWVDEIRRNGIYAPELSSMKDVVEYLLNLGGDRVVFIDELQNGIKVNMGFIHDLQRLLDRHRDRRIVVSGSTIGMTKKLVEGYRSPLYGRFDAVIKLRELRFATVAEIALDLGYSVEDAVLLHSVFGGVPKYYETLERARGDPEGFVRSMFFEDPYPLVEEVRAMLREEFGREFKNFFSVLEAVSATDGTLGEVAGYLGEAPTRLTKYLHALERDYEMLDGERCVLGGGRKAYRIAQNLVDFWFRFVWRNYPDRLGEGGREFSEGLDGFLASRFERLAGEIAVLPFEPNRKGRWWGARREGGERRVEEIDLVALDERASQIAFVEAKWSRLGEREARRELGRLGEKAKLVDWRPGSRKEHFGLVAREVGGKEGLRKEGYMVFDLEDLRGRVRRREGDGVATA